jgi:MFS family permease
VSRQIVAFAFLTGALPIFVISVCSRATDNMVSTTLPLLGEYVFGLGTFYGGVATSLYSAAGLFANYFVNPRISGKSRRRVVIASSGAIVALVLLLSVADALTTLAIGLCVSFMLGIEYPSIIAAASLDSGNQGERLVSLFSVGLSVSLILGPSLESYLLNFSYSALFLAFALVALVGFFASWKVKFSGEASETWQRNPATEWGVVAGLLCAAVFFVPFAAFTAFLPIYAARVYSVGTSVAYSSFIPLFVVSFLTRAYMTVRPIENLRLPMAASMVVTVGGLLLMILAPSFPLFLLVMAAFGFPHGISYTVSLIIVARTSPKDERNAAMSRLAAYSNILNILVPVAISYLILLVGIHASFAFLLLPSTVAALFFARSYGKSLDSVSGDWSQGQRPRAVYPKTAG